MGTIIVALLSFAGNYISNHKSNAIWQYRVQQLEIKQDKHNQVIERTAALEKKSIEQEKDTINAFDQIKDVKDSVEKVENTVGKIQEDVQEIKEAKVRIEAKIN